MRQIGAGDDERLAVLQDLRQGAPEPGAHGLIVGADDDRQDLRRREQVLDERHLDLDRVLARLGRLVEHAVGILPGQRLGGGAIDSATPSGVR